MLAVMSCCGKVIAVYRHNTDPVLCPEHGGLALRESN